MNVSQTNTIFSETRTCAGILRQEIELLERINILQSMVRNAVTTREWADFEGYMDTLNSIGEEFRVLDAQRERIFSVFARQNGSNNAGVGFYSLIAGLPEPERRELSALYRKLKMDTLKIGFTNDSLTAYIEEARSTLQGFLDAAFPDRKGRLYSSRGIQVPADMRSMVLNQSL
jgi:hypothetical protein